MAVIAPGFSPALGGVETHVSALTTRLVERGLDVEAWVHDRTDRQESREVRDGVRVRRFPGLFSDRYPVSPALWRHVRRHAGEVDLIHAHSYHSTASLSALLAPKHVPLVFTPHYHGTGHTRLSAAAHRPYRSLGRRLYERATRVIAVSGTEKSLILRDFPAADGRCQTIHNGVDNEWIADAHAFRDQAATLLILGRLEPYKRIDAVIAAFSVCSTPGQLVILGDGPDRGRLEALRDQSERRADIRLLGRVDAGVVARWLVTARAVISMSEHEAFGLTALEGMTAGAVPILSDIPAHREVLALAGLASFLHDPRHVGRLADACDQALRTPPTGGRVIRDWREVAAEHVRAYEQCLGAVAGELTSSSKFSSARTVSSHERGSW